MMDIIGAALRDEKVSVEKLERLIALRDQEEKKQHERAYIEAMEVLHGSLRSIPRKGLITYPGKEGKSASSVKFATYEDMDAIMRPLLREFGFTLSFSYGSVGGIQGYVMKCRHTLGHVEQTLLPLGADKSGGKNDVQAVGSSITYVQRYLMKMGFNLTIKDDPTDDNGARAYAAITDSQAIDIEDKLKLSGRDKTAFLEWVREQNGQHITSIDKIPAGAFEGIIKTLNIAIAQGGRKK